MRARYKIDHPDSAEASATITMTVGEWQQLSEQVDQAKTALSSYPAFRLLELIREIVTKARTVYSAEHKNP